ncbi:hypothetical protein ACL6C3_05395 [Capilliphycus salinus ALCB114379]|uniref:hypothetical protein n=1 Tax=Capilliphycus salinus TaxID=2768948 RepID=UPI0039A64526
MKRTILLGSLIVSTGLTLTQALSWSNNSSRFSLNKLTPNREMIIVYEGTDEDGETETVETKPKS